METHPSYFGEYLRSLRMQNRVGLRQFCLSTKQDPAYVSKVERRLLSAPQSVDVLKRYGEALGLFPEQQERLQDLAFTDNGLIPPDVWERRDPAQYLPAFWHGWRNLPPEEIERFIQKCKEA